MCNLMTSVVCLFWFSAHFSQFLSLLALQKPTEFYKMKANAQPAFIDE